MYLYSCCNCNVRVHVVFYVLPCRIPLCSFTDAERVRPRDAHVASRPNARLADGRDARTGRRWSPLPRARRPTRGHQLAQVMLRSSYAIGRSHSIPRTFFGVTFTLALFVSALALDVLYLYSYILSKCTVLAVCT